MIILMTVNSIHFLNSKNKRMKQIQIFMPLLNEGTTVSRPVIALDMGNNIYQIVGTEQGLSPEDLDEEWLFPIGSYVTCKTVLSLTGTKLVADKLSNV